MYVKKIRIAVAETTVPPDEWLNHFLQEDDIRLVGVFKDLAAADEKLNGVHVDILLIDGMPAEDSTWQRLEQIGYYHPTLKILRIFTSEEDFLSPMVGEKYQIKGRLAVPYQTDQLIAAVRRIAGGSEHFPEGITEAIAPPEQSAEEVRGATELSDRELDILQLMAIEYSTFEISLELNISKSTVEERRDSMFRKLNAENIAGLVRHASQIGVI